MINTVLYLRYSSHSQREVSIEQQQKECELYAQRNGMRIVDMYIDRAISGKQIAKRDRFQDMINDAPLGRFEAILVYQLDRFARNRRESQITKHFLRQHGIRVISATEYIASGPSGILVESMLEGYAEFYSADLSQKIRRGMDWNASQGLTIGGSRMLGYASNGEKKIVIDPLTAPIVRTIFEMYAQGYSCTEIMQHLNDAGHKTSQGKPFNKNSIRRILENRKYLGYYIYKGEVINRSNPQIISDELFEEVQRMLKINGQVPGKFRAKTDFLLSSKLFCGLCGRMMVGTTGTSGTKGKKYHYYECNGNRGKGRDCPLKRIRKETLEDIVVINTSQHILTDGMIVEIARNVAELCEKEYADDSKIRALEEKIKETQRIVKNLYAALEMAPSTGLAERLKEREEELESLQASLVVAKTDRPMLSQQQVVDFLTSLKGGDINNIFYRRALIDTLVFRVELYEEKVVIYYTNSDKYSVNLDKEKRETDAKSSHKSPMVELMLPQSNLRIYPTYTVFTVSLAA